MTGYATEEAAFARVNVLKQHGIWPGVFFRHGRWHLTYDPKLY